PLMEKIETAMSIKKTKEIELEQELGLTKQSLLSNTELLMSDIDELTSSKNYYPVSEKMLNKMFGMRRLLNKCLIHNAKEIIINSAISTVTPLPVCLVLLAFCIWGSIEGSQHGIALLKAISIGGIIISSFGAIIGLIVLCNKGIKISYDFVITRLKTENIKSTSKKIPYGALLKLKEAKDTEIFKDFIIAYPDVNMKHKEIDIQLPRMELDPALLGVTDDNRMFLICWWDIKHDIDKADKKIDWIKNFKVEVN
ncbi:hypothetical protein KY317_00180, partial [Candidatus Woesearchaeota archaeon]|nr:hypothetical protein [Candidatus Woesearchaeota archaeon]